MSSSIYLDIGNSFAKWKFEGKFFKKTTSEFSLDKLPKSSKIWVSNVSSNFTCSSNSNISLVKSQKSYKSLTNSYDEPDSLGSDRWLAMIASYEMNLGRGFILVDIGTAVTIDLVDNSGLHLGGVIFPGLYKVRWTFENFSVSSEIKTNKIIQSTEDAWSIGTFDLIVNGINQKIHELKQKTPSANIYFTGGGFEDIRQFVEFPYDYHKNLVLDGLELFADNVG